MRNGCTRESVYRSQRYNCQSVFERFVCQFIPFGSSLQGHIRSMHPLEDIMRNEVRIERIQALQMDLRAGLMHDLYGVSDGTQGSQRQQKMIEALRSGYMVCVTFPFSNKLLQKPHRQGICPSLDQAVPLTTWPAAFRQSHRIPNHVPIRRSVSLTSG